LYFCCSGLSPSLTRLTVFFPFQPACPLGGCCLSLARRPPRVSCPPPPPRTFFSPQGPRAPPPYHPGQRPIPKGFPFKRLSCVSLCPFTYGGENVRFRFNSFAKFLTGPLVFITIVSPLPFCNPSAVGITFSSGDLSTPGFFMTAKKRGAFLPVFTAGQELTFPT